MTSCMASCADTRLRRMNDSYLVPAGYGEGLYEDRRSKFIGEIFPVETPE